MKKQTLHAADNSYYRFTDTAETRGICFLFAQMKKLPCRQLSECDEFCSVNDAEVLQRIGDAVVVNVGCDIIRSGL